MDPAVQSSHSVQHATQPPVSMQQLTSPSSSSSKLQTGIVLANIQLPVVQTGVKRKGKVGVKLFSPKEVKKIKKKAKLEFTVFFQKYCPPDRVRKVKSTATTNIVNGSVVQSGFASAGVPSTSLNSSTVVATTQVTQQAYLVVPLSANSSSSHLTSKPRAAKATAQKLLTSTSGSQEPPLVTIPVTPPNWKSCYDQTLLQTKLPHTYKLFKVHTNTVEYETIVNLLKPVNVASVQKIVNPNLWRKYQSQRNEMIKQKSEDSDVLIALGLSKEDVKKHVLRIKKFSNNYTLCGDAGEYSLNEALLFSSNGYLENVEKILTENIQHRIGNNQKDFYLGHGICFTDNLLKSNEYSNGTNTIIIFMVLLGDCKDVEDGTEVAGSSKQPQKLKAEKRNISDFAFDSITARPVNKGINEYVIYNQDQCYPLYQIEIKNDDSNNATINSIISPSSSILTLSALQNMDNYYLNARSKSPNIAWCKRSGSAPYFNLPNNSKQNSLKWPFLAQELFNKMIPPYVT